MLSLSVDGLRGGSPLSRRAFLRTSLLTAGALGLPNLLQQRARAAGTRRDTAVIQLWLGGGPSHLDMYDLKPAAPAEVRGPFKPIRSNVPGLDVCELLPRQARLLDRLTVVRSLRHNTDEHAQGMHWGQTGYFAPLIDDSTAATHPSFGSIGARLRGPNRPGMPPYVHVAPDPMGIPLFLRIFESAYLGASYSPLRIESARKVTDRNRGDVLDNLIGKPQFAMPCFDLLPGLSADRLGDRLELSRQFDRLNQQLDRSRAAGRLDRFQRQALELVTGDAARTAFDLDRENPRLRDRYGRNAWGQGLLLCRRLVEAGVTFVTLNTDSFSGIWDNHVNIKPNLEAMLPVYDQMLTALLEDLIDRGLYERVLLLVWGEFGRTPKLNAGAGRDHWGRAGFALLGGAGLRTGQVIGSTTPRGEEPKERPLWPTDVLATVYHVLGIDPEVEFPDHLGRPIKVLSTGEPIRELI